MVPWELADCCVRNMLFCVLMAPAGDGVLITRQMVLSPRAFSRDWQRRGLSNNGTASGDRGLKTAGLPPLAVRMLVRR
jgi:hypothetical protein